MSEWAAIVGFTLTAGLAMPAGAIVARFERLGAHWLEDEVRHAVIAFGGGVLLAAITLVLVPEGSRNLPPTLIAICFASGGVAFMALDLVLDSLGNPASQLVAMLTDFIPEALALGAIFASGSVAGPLLAGLIALQNLPEGFNAYRELSASPRFSARRVIAAFSAMALLGPLAGLAGYYWLSAYPAAVSGIMLFAAGGILYLIFQDIAPQAKLERHWAPALGAVGGFLLGMVGHAGLTR